jgi:hypothetical protein
LPRARFESIYRAVVQVAAVKIYVAAVETLKKESIHSSCTGSSSENICSSSGGAQEKGRQYETESTTKIDGF